MRIHWQEQALDEFEASAIWYEAQEPGLGGDFISSLEAALTRIRQEPELPRIFEAGCRRVRLSRFPYSVIYRSRDGGAQIVVVMHQKRRPGYWHERL